MIRINKYLAALGVASRRRIDDLIRQGRIFVNGLPAQVGQKLLAGTDVITVDGREVKTVAPRLVYYALHKPPAVLSTTKDDWGRPTVLDLVPAQERLYPVGRLDYNSTGLILLTNDGRLALRLTHPRYHLPKTYLVTLAGRVTPGQIRRLSRGMVIDGQKTLPAVVQNFHETISHTILKITLRQGRKRQIRRQCADLGLPLTALHRLSIGPILLGNLPPGRSRMLTSAEIDQLKNM